MLRMGQTNGKPLTVERTRKVSSRSQSDISTSTVDDYGSRTGTLSSVDSLKIDAVKISEQNGVPSTSKTPSTATASSVFTHGSTTKSSTPTTSIGNRSEGSTSSSPPPTNTNNNHKEVPPLPPKPQRAKKVAKLSPFDKLTDNVITKIFSFLPTKSLCRCSIVCRRWHRLTWQPPLWSSITLSGRYVDVDLAMETLLTRLSKETPYVCLTVQRIILNGCERLSDFGLRVIAEKCPELIHLELRGCYFITNEAVFDVVSRCSALDHLDVAGCLQLNCMNLPVEPTSLEPSFFTQKINLRVLDMSDCKRLDDNGLRTIATNCPALVNVYLRKCVLISDIGVQYLSSFCLMLKEVSINDCPRVTDFGLRELAKLETHLRYLSIAKCELVTDIGINVIAKSCPKLRYLNARGCIHITDRSLEALARGCPKLRSLDIGKCMSVSDKGLLSVINNCSCLRKVSLKGCMCITDRSIQVLASKCPELQQLNIQDCCQISRDAYRLLKKNCRKCIIEHTNPGYISSVVDSSTVRSIKRQLDTVPLTENKENRSDLILFRHMGGESHISVWLFFRENSEKWIRTAFTGFSFRILLREPGRILLSCHRDRRLKVPSEGR